MAMRGETVQLSTLALGSSVMALQDDGNYILIGLLGSFCEKMIDMDSYYNRYNKNYAYIIKSIKCLGESIQSEDHPRFEYVKSYHDILWNLYSSLWCDLSVYLFIFCH